MRGSSSRVCCARHALLVAWPLLALVACNSVPSGRERREDAQALAQTQGWFAQTVRTPAFELSSWLPPKVDPSEELVIYIEGDGLAYIADDRPALDPTPLDPMALRLALAQPDGNRAVLDRPCQYVEEGPHCAQRYWTSARFAPEVIGAMSAALDLLRERFRAKRLILVGYSGGASVAALLAERRTDVVGLVTVAGNLDHRAWTAWHHVSPLTGSLDPVDDVSALQRVPQIHLAGENDRIVPPELLEEFARRIPGAKVEILKGYDHHCCWAENWPVIWRSITWVDPTDR